MHDPELAASHRKIDAWIRETLLRAMDRVGEEGGLRPGLDRPATAHAITALLWGLTDIEEDSAAVLAAAAHMIAHALCADQPPGLARTGPER